MLSVSFCFVSCEGGNILNDTSVRQPTPHSSLNSWCRAHTSLSPALPIYQETPST